MISVLRDDLPDIMLVSVEKLSDAIMVLFISFSSNHCRANDIANSSVVYTDKWFDTLLICDSLTGMYTAAPAHPVSGYFEPSVNINTESEKC